MTCVCDLTFCPPCHDSGPSTVVKAMELRHPASGVGGPAVGRDPSRLVPPVGVPADPTPESVRSWIDELADSGDLEANHLIAELRRQLHEMEGTSTC